MGVRIAFYETTDGKSLFDNFNRTFSDFKTWLLKENNKCIIEYNERIISVTIETFLINSSNTININHLPKELIDELIIEYLLTYCDHGKGKVNINLIGPLISRHKYNNSFNIIKKTKDEKLIRFWNYLKVGRSLKDDKDFTEIESDLIGFWTKSEIIYIKEKIRNLDQSDVGIECISEVLNEIDEKSELIFNLET